MLRIVTAMATALLLVAAGCSANGPSPSSTPEPSIIKASSSSPESEPTPTPTPTPAKADTLEVGDTWVSKTLKITLIKTDFRIKEDYSPKVVQGILLKTCVRALPKGEKSVQLGWSAWTLGDDDSGRYQNNGTTGGDLPQPTYPNGDRDFKVGDCAKGWVFFSAGKKTKIKTVNYDSKIVGHAQWKI